MLIEFMSVVSDFEEQYQKDKDEDLKGISSITWENKNDKLVPTVVDISNVIGWEVGKVVYNDRLLPCIFIQFKESDSRNIVITHTEFSKIIENFDSKRKVYKHTDLLKRLEQEI